MGRWAAADVSDQSGRIVVVTGGGAGLGLETAAVLAAHGATVVLACRDVGKAARAADRIRARAGRADVRVVRLDLASPPSVRAAAGEIRTSCGRLDLLFTYELQARLAAAGAPARALAAHPGNARTGLWGTSSRLERALISRRLRPLNSWLAQDASAGALPILRAATDPSARGGDFYGPSGRFQYAGPPARVDSSERSRDDTARRRLWELSEQVTGVSYQALLT